MGFFQFLKKIKNRRLLVPALVALFVVVFSGTIFGLAKTGKLKSFADEVVKTAQQVSPRAFGQSGTIVVRTGTPVGNTLIYIFRSGNNSYYNYGYTDSTGAVTFYNTFAPDGYYAVAPNSGCPATSSQNLSPGQTLTLDVNAGCGGLPPVAGAKTSVYGLISDSTTRLKIAGANVTIGNKNATSNSDGRYSITDIVPGVYTAAVSAIGFNTLTQSVTLNPDSTAPSASLGNERNFPLSRIIPQYRFAGAVYGQVGAVTSPLAGANISLIDLANGNRVLTQVTTGTANTVSIYDTTSAGYVNFETPSIPLTDYTLARCQTLAFRVTKTNFVSRDVKLSDLFFAGTPVARIFGQGNDVYTALVFNQLTLLSTSPGIDVLYSVKTDCRDNTLCPNRDPYGQIDKIPVIITGYSDQLSDNNFHLPSGGPTGTANGFFKGINISKSLDVWVNPTTNPNYQPLYETKQFTFTSAQLQNLVGVKELKLAKNPNYSLQSDKFDLQGKIVESSPASGTKPIVADIRVNCEDPASACAMGSKFGSAKWQLSKDTLPYAQTNGSEQNYLFSNLYNIAQAGPAVDRLVLEITKPGYYLDVNSNSIKDVGEDGKVFVSKSDIIAPTTAGGKSVAKINGTLRTLASSQARIYGTIKAQDTNRFLPGVVKLNSIDSHGAIEVAGEISAIAGADGKYDFSGKLNAVDRNKTYWLTATANDTSYSSEMYAIRLSTSPVLNINFILAKNSSGLVVFKGYVQNILPDGSMQNIVAAQVDAYLDEYTSDNRIGTAGTTASNPQYALTLDKARISGDATTGTTSVVLTGFNGPSSTETKHKSYKFQIPVDRGVLIRCDFIFSDGDRVDVLPPSKNVEIKITGQTKGYRPISSGKPEMINKNTPSPLANIPVQLVSSRNDNQTGSSGLQVSSAVVTTGSDGIARFPGWPQQSSEILVTIDNVVWTLDTGSGALTLPASQTTKTINYWKTDWDPTKLLSMAEQINMQQADPRWGGIATRSIGTIGDAGCCVTSFSMAVKFYYSEKNDFSGRLPRQTMDPSVSARVINEDGILGLYVDNGFPGIASGLNRRYNTKISSRDININEIDSYLKAGIPVVIHGRGMVNGNGSRLTMHCVLLVGKTSNGQYIVDDPAFAAKIYKAPLSQFGRIDKVFIITTPDARAGFANLRGRKSGSLVKAYAAEGATGNENASTAEDYTVSAAITTTTAVPIEEGFLVLKRPGMADMYILASRDGDTFTATIPKHLIGHDFTYKFVAIDALFAELSSQDYPVSVDHAPASATTEIARAWSALKFNTSNARTNTGLALDQINNQLNAAFQRFRNNFNSFLRWLNIGQTDMVPVSGQVVNGSGQRMPKVLVKIWEDAALSNSGRFTVANVRKGQVTISVIDQMSGKQLSVVNPTITVSRAMSGYNLVIDDPSDVGGLTARVFANSVQNIQMNDGTLLNSGKLQLIRNSQVEKEINLSSTAGKINSLTLPVGTYSMKYLLSDGSERPVGNFNGGSTIKIQKGVALSEIFKVDNRSTFSIHISSQNGGADCNVYWWYHLYITDPTGYTADFNRPPTDCTLNYSMNPGRFSFRMTDNYGYNRVITPAYFDVPPFLNGKTYELGL